jgi:hypothetical protein
MFCPQCHAEYREQLSECPDCQVPLVDDLSDTETPPDSPADLDLDVLIRTGIADPVAAGLVKSLFREAGIPFFAMDQNIAARQESGNLLGWWNVRVPRDREAEAREILKTVEEMR